VRVSEFCVDWKVKPDLSVLDRPWFAGSGKWGWESRWNCFRRRWRANSSWCGCHTVRTAMPVTSLVPRWRSPSNRLTRTQHNTSTNLRPHIHTLIIVVNPVYLLGERSLHRSCFKRSKRFLSLTDENAFLTIFNFHFECFEQPLVTASGAEHKLH